MVVYLRYYVVMPIILTLVPLLFLYVKALTIEYYTYSLKTLKHFIPALSILIINIVFYGFLLSHEEKYKFVTESYLYDFNSVVIKMKIMIASNIISEIMYYIQVVFYIILMLLLLNKHKKNIEKYFSYKEKISLNWIKIFILIFIMISVLDILENYYFLKRNETWESIWKTINGVGNIMYICFLGYFGIKQTDIYAGIIKISADGTKQKFDTYDNILEKKDKYISSSLSDEQKQLIVARVIKITENDKLYLNKKLTIDELADKLCINKKYLSQAINEILKRNFYHFVNKYRIKEAQRLLSDPGSRNITIEGIADSSGFNSKSSFNTTFKKNIGITPSDYLKTCLREN